MFNNRPSVNYIGKKEETRVQTNGGLSYANIKQSKGIPLQYTNAMKSFIRLKEKNMAETTKVFIANNPYNNGDRHQQFIDKKATSLKIVNEPINRIEKFNELSIYSNSVSQYDDKLTGNIHKPLPFEKTNLNLNARIRQRFNQRRHTFSQKRNQLNGKSAKLKPAIRQNIETANHNPITDLSTHDSRQSISVSGFPLPTLNPPNSIRAPKYDSMCLDISTRFGCATCGAFVVCIGTDAYLEMCNHPKVSVEMYYI